MTDDHQKQLTDHRVKLLQFMDPTGMVNYLRGIGVLTSIDTDVEWQLPAMKPTAIKKRANENKNGGGKDCVDLWATLKALNTLGSSTETRH